jgi:proline dehydrogenase
MDTSMHFLQTSFNTLVARTIPFVPRALIQKISKRYIAGETLGQAVERIRALNQQGFSVTVDVLGETVTTLQAMQSTVDEYLQVLQSISAHGLNASISVKPTAFGLLSNHAQCKQMLEQLVHAANQHKTTVCIDMESVDCTEKEIELFNLMKSRHTNVSLALQAYLLRTYQDIEPLLQGKSSLRVCKGIYLEDRLHLVEGAQHDRQAINRHFLHHVERCFTTGSFVAIATHDEALIDQVIALINHKGIPTTAFEFQMLLGVCETLRDKLLTAGFNVRIYVPYGKDWYGYSTRRIKENPSIAGYVLKAMFGT